MLTVVFMATIINRGMSTALAIDSQPTPAQKEKGQKAKVIQVYFETPQQRAAVIGAMRRAIDPRTGRPYKSLSRWLRDLALTGAGKQIILRIKPQKIATPAAHKGPNLAEIARILGVSRQFVHQLKRRNRKS